MDKHEWGHCKDCKWWQLEPGAAIAKETMGQCIEDELMPFQLRVSGSSGCNVFQPGKPARAKGSSAEPPVAAATR